MCLARTVLVKVTGGVGGCAIALCSKSEAEQEWPRSNAKIGHLHNNDLSERFTKGAKKSSGQATNM